MSLTYKFVARFIRSFNGGTITTDDVNLIWTPGQKCKKDAENDSLGIFQKPPCELLDANQNERDLTENLDAIQVA